MQLSPISSLPLVGLLMTMLVGKLLWTSNCMNALRVLGRQLGRSPRTLTVRVLRKLCRKGVRGLTGAVVSWLCVASLWCNRSMLVIVMVVDVVIIGYELTRMLQFLNTIEVVSYNIWSCIVDSAIRVRTINVVVVKLMILT